MKFTSEQIDAIFTHDCNLIVTAGAGSGKTRVLVERFMAMLESNRDWTLPSVVAITFTEKAAREMRNRVREAIEERIQQCALEQQRDDLNRWLNHQAALDNARITTIHGLCAQILRANPAEAGIDPGFDVLDENEAAVVLDDAVDQAMARLVHEGHEAAALLTVYGVRDVRKVLKEYATKAINLPDDVWGEWQKAWAMSIREVIADVRVDRNFHEALSWIQPADLPPGDKLSEVWQLVFDSLPDLLENDDPKLFSGAVNRLVNGIKLNGGTVANWGSKENVDSCKAVLKSIRQCMLTAQGNILDSISERDQQAAAYLHMWNTALQFVTQTYTDLKRQHNALDFDDLETLTCHLLKRHPAVAARYVTEFRHVLVDEFQDTNGAQRDIIYYLTGVRQADGNGRLFVVGDPKQSIYAFRGADVGVFDDVRRHLVESKGRELPLATSFRTHERLVSAFNDLFGRIMQPSGGRYEVSFDRPMAAFRPSELDDHPLAVFVFRQPDKDRYPDCQSMDDIRRWEAWTVAHYIHDLVGRGMLVWDRSKKHGDYTEDCYIPNFAKDFGQGLYRPMTYGDVTLLFQAMTRAPLYEDVFKAAGLPYVTVAGKGYYDRQEVWDLLNLLAALHNPADDLALAVALRSPLFGLSDDALYALRLAHDDQNNLLPLWDALISPDVPFFPPHESEARAFAAYTLLELRDMAGRATIADLLTRALNLTGYQATLTGLADGARRRGNVEKLLRLARESGRVSLGAFNAYARDLTAREVREGEAAVEVEGAVTLMSVHASKGLEFPVVGLLDSSWDRNRRDGLFVFDPEIGPACKLPKTDPDNTDPESFAWEWACKLAERRDQAERRRLLYVGATRAQDHLIVSGSLYRCGEQAWLRQWLKALDVPDDGLIPSPEPFVMDHDWGTCAIYVPDVPPHPEALMPRADDRRSGWDDLAADGYDPLLPPLLNAVEVKPDAPARALTATQIAKLGRASYYDPAQIGLAAFRNSVLYDAPEPIRPLPDPQGDDLRLRRVVGEIVHRALRAWLLPGDTDPALMIKRLETYAWEQHLTHPEQVKFAVNRALELLRRFEQSEIAAELARASQVYRELPFIYRADQRTIHGVIDVLYFDRRNRWHVLDYKTAPVSVSGAYSNARRYYLQIGVYAAAIQAKTGQTPETSLYYIHPGKLVYVKTEDWQAALSRLEADLQVALRSGE